MIKSLPTASFSSACVGFLPKRGSHVTCMNCSKHQDEHQTAFISPMVKQTYAQSPKKVPPPRPKTPPNLQYRSDPDLNLTKGSTKSEGQGRSDGADSKKRAAKTTSSTDTTNKAVTGSLTPAIPPARPKRTESHKEKNHVRRIMRSAKLKQRNAAEEQGHSAKETGGDEEADQSKQQTDDSVRPSRPRAPRPMKPDPSAYNDPTIYEAAFTNVKATPPRNFHKLKKRRAPTPTRKLGDNETAEDAGSIHGDTETVEKSSSNISEETKILQQKLATLNAQLRYIDQKAKKLSAAQPHPAVQQSNDSSCDDLAMPASAISNSDQPLVAEHPDQPTINDEEVLCHPEVDPQTNTGVRFDLDNVTVINDHITRYLFESLSSSEEDDYFDQSGCEEQTADQSEFIEVADQELDREDNSEQSQSYVTSNLTSQNSHELENIPAAITCDFPTNAGNDIMTGDTIDEEPETDLQDGEDSVTEDWPAPPYPDIILEEDGSDQIEGTTLEPSSMATMQAISQPNSAFPKTTRLQEMRELSKASLLMLHDTPLPSSDVSRSPSLPNTEMQNVSMTLTTNTETSEPSQTDRMSENSVGDTHTKSSSAKLRAVTPKRDRKTKDAAPAPPSVRAPSLRQMALRIDPRSYLHSAAITGNDAFDETKNNGGNNNNAGRRRHINRKSPTKSNKSQRSHSADRILDEKKLKMPRFFKSLMRKAKSKSDLMQPDPDFEHIPQPEGPASDTEEHRNDYGHEENGHHHDEYDDNLGAKGEFLDTWVSSTTNQLMEEMDFALKGVWPYDKKEEEEEQEEEDDDDAYDRKLSIPNDDHDIIEVLDPEPLPTSKRKSKGPTSPWSDRESVDQSSNFILKEKTRKYNKNSATASLKSQFRSNPSLSMMGSTQTLNRINQKKAPAPQVNYQQRRGSSHDLTEMDMPVPYQVPVHVDEGSTATSSTRYKQELRRLRDEKNALEAQKKARRASQSQENLLMMQAVAADVAHQQTLKKKKNKSSAPELSVHQPQEVNRSRSPANSILKNGGSSNSSTVGSSVSKATKRAPPVVSHGRQSSVPSSTYSGSSSGGERTKDDEKLSPTSTMNPHDSGYESGTVRSRRDLQLMSKSHDFGYESATLMRPNKRDLASAPKTRDSSFGGGTMMRPKRETALAASSDFATLKRVKKSPTLSVQSRATQKTPGAGSGSAIDSIPLCFEQLTSLNASTLQQLCAAFVQSQKPLQLPDISEIRWHDIVVVDELTPVFNSTKIVLYRAHWRSKAEENFTVMLSLKAPASFDGFKPNILRTNVSFEANVAPHLIPDSLYVGKKQMSKLKGVVNAVMALKPGGFTSTPKAAATKPDTLALKNEPARPHSASFNDKPNGSCSRPAYQTQKSVDTALDSSRTQPRSVKPENQLSAVSIPSTPAASARASAISHQGSDGSVQDEIDAVDSILDAVAGEDSSPTSQVHTPEPGKVGRIAAQMFNKPETKKPFVGASMYKPKQAAKKSDEPESKKPEVAANKTEIEAKPSVPAVEKTVIDNKKPETVAVKTEEEPKPSESGVEKTVDNKEPEAVAVEEAKPSTPELEKATVAEKKPETDVLEETKSIIPKPEEATVEDTKPEAADVEKAKPSTPELEKATVADKKPETDVLEETKSTIPKPEKATVADTKPEAADVEETKASTATEERETPADKKPDVAVVEEQKPSTPTAEKDSVAEQKPESAVETVTPPSEPVVEKSVVKETPVASVAEAEVKPEAIQPVEDKAVDDVKPESATKTKTKASDPPAEKTVDTKTPTVEAEPKPSVTPVEKTESTDKTKAVVEKEAEKVDNDSVDKKTGEPVLEVENTKAEPETPKPSEPVKEAEQKPTSLPESPKSDQRKEKEEVAKKPAETKPEPESNLPLESTAKKSKYAEPVIPRLDENKNFDDLPLIPRAKKTSRDLSSIPDIQDIKIRPNRGPSSGKLGGLASRFETKNDKKVDKILPTLRTAGAVRNRIANFSGNNNNNNSNNSSPNISSRYNLNSNNSNSNDLDYANLNSNNNNSNDSEDDDTSSTSDTLEVETSESVQNEEQDIGNDVAEGADTPTHSDEYDPSTLNSNNNNNLDDILASSSGGGGFAFDSHFMEMAGGDMYQPMQAEEAVEPDTTIPTPRGAAGLPRHNDRRVAAVQNVTCNVTILPTVNQVESAKEYLERLKAEERDTNDLEMDVIFILLQVLNIVFGLHESQLRLESISTSDFIIITDENDVATLHCHNVNVTQTTNQKIGLTCEKLRMFLMQVSHATPSLKKSVLFTTVDDMVQNAEDMGDLRTIGAILQYLLWGPKEDEVKIITLAEHRRQAFELWLHLARGKLMSGLALKPIDNIKAYMVTSFLANTNGSELFKITKLLNTY